MEFCTPFTLDDESSGRVQWLEREGGAATKSLTTWALQVFLPAFTGQPARRRWLALTLAPRYRGL